MPATPSRPTTAVRSAPPSFAPGAPALVPRLDAHGCEGRRTGGPRTGGLRTRGLRTGGDAGGAPGPSRRPPGPYRRLFGIPGTRAFTAAGLLARLPAGMFGVSAILMIADTRGSYALAGAVTATGLASTALVAPVTARLVDRYGQARVAVPAALLAVLGQLALVLCVRSGAPAWTLFAAYAATATCPNVGGMCRARWGHLLRGAPGARHTANAVEQAVDELCFMLGPVLAALLCSALFVEAGTVAAALLLLSGVLLFAAQRGTEPPVSGRSTAAAPVRVPGMRPLLGVFLATGAVFGATEVVTLAEVGGAAGGAVLGLAAAGSGAAGLLYGRTRRAVALPWCLAGMTALTTLPLLAAVLTDRLALLAAALLVAGTATAPAMVAGMTAVQRLTSAGRANEGMTLAVTALLGGIAAGSAAGGWTVERLEPAAGYLVPVCAAALAWAVAAAGRGRGGRA
ncbi:MFS transporter [Streptomyces sp. NPDC048001]|uniref:MFS transporter n=1 Tax=Streptomyces sp. NPDC048001 TaxID=3365498 RepID=UPI003723A0DC